MRGNILNMTIRIKDRENIKKRQILLKNPENKIQVDSDAGKEKS